MIGKGLPAVKCDFLFAWCSKDRWFLQHRLTFPMYLHVPNLMFLGWVNICDAMNMFFPLDVFLVYLEVMRLSTSVWQEGHENVFPVAGWGAVLHFCVQFWQVADSWFWTQLLDRSWNDFLWALHLQIWRPIVFWHVNIFGKHHVLVHMCLSARLCLKIHTVIQCLCLCTYTISAITGP